jgi:hypothetical protein
VCLAATPAMAALVVRIGDMVYVDGKQYTWEEWQKIRDEPRASAVATKAAAVAQPHAASCSSAVYYDEFPPDDERFDCSADLGRLTREELLRQGWKIDLIEKIPAPSQAQSARGLPLYRYKLVISR